MAQLTPPRTHSTSGLKSWVLKKFWLKNNGENWYTLYYFEIQQAPSELLLPSAEITLNFLSILLNFKINNSRILFFIIFNSKMSISRHSRFFSTCVMISSWCTNLQPWKGKKDINMSDDVNLQIIYWAFTVRRNKIESQSKITRNLYRIE